ncbi:MAG TPA: FtsW/RodA/SpoVE family cell cycle protein [Gemmatimonadaceae bacterium]
MTEPFSPPPSKKTSNPMPGMRERWRMGPEARAMVLVSAVLSAFGLAVLYSASAFVATSEHHGDSAYFLVKQIQGLLAGMLTFAIAAKFDAGKLEKWAWPIMWFTIASMTAVLILPGSLAPTIHGSRRFLIGASFQPSEFAKLSVVVWVSMLIIKKGDTLKRLTKGLVPFLVVIGLLDVLAALEPDLSVAMLFTLLMALLLFVGGARMSHFIALAAMCLPLTLTKIEKWRYAFSRITAFLHPGNAPEAVSFQLKQSLIAVGSGGWFGRGFGEGMQQQFFVPFPYSDFVASNVGEEWGFVGIAGITIAFALYGLLGFRIARQARTPFLQLVAVGLTFTTVLTAFLHIGVVIGLLPTTGLTLPFVSFGRSNLVLTLLFTGILVNIGSARERVTSMAPSDPMAPVPA